MHLVVLVPVLFLPFPFFLFLLLFSELEILWLLVKVKKNKMAGSKPQKKGLTLDLSLLEGVGKAPKCGSMPKQTTKN